MQFVQWFKVGDEYKSISAVIEDGLEANFSFDIVEEMKAAIREEGIREGGIPCDPPQD